MELGVELAITLGLFLLLMGLGADIAISIMVPAMLYLYLQGGIGALNSLPFTSWGTLNSFTLTAIPLFLLMAEVLGESGLSTRVYRGLGKLVSFLPGGLLQTNIAGCAVFASVCGSSIATAASVGRVALPQLSSQGYNVSLSVGSLAAGGTLGILIPPSLAMIIYSGMTETSIPQLFMAGMVPGFLLAMIFMTYISIRCAINPALAPRAHVIASPRDFLGALGDILPFLIIIVGSLGSLYAGWVTTTEAATVGSLLAIALGFTVGDLTLRKFYVALQKTIIVSAAILFLVLAAFMFSAALGFGGLNEALTEFVKSLSLTKVQFYVSVFAIYILLGMFIESIPMVLITVPLIFPLLQLYGVDPILFGVLIVMFIELALITPPVGVNLFVIQGISGASLSQVVRGALPFTVMIFLGAVALTIWPQIALWLPYQLLR
jgi:tripartite ATP-independent transporter DctM subunit